MKKLIISAILITVTLCNVTAQTPYDALNLIQSDITGSARYMSMGGAFGALGGDATAIKDNPAGLGIFRKSEISTTLDILSQNSYSNWEGTKAQDDLYKLGFNHFAYIIAAPTWRNGTENEGLKYSNWSFSYNKLRDFNKRSYIKGKDLGTSITDFMAYFSNNTSGNLYNFDNYPISGSNTPWDNVDISWLSVMAAYGGLMDEYVDNSSGQTAYWASFLNVGETVSPSYILEESGALNEYTFGWSGNFSNKFYLGLNLNLQSINYNLSTLYSETFGNGGSMDLYNWMSTSGAGVNFKIGAIYTPLDFMRIGIAYHSPTVYALSDVGSSELDFDANSNGYISTPTNTLDYQLKSPTQLNASLGFIFGNKGLFSAEYVYNNYTATRFYDSNGKSTDYLDENLRIKEYLKDSRTIKIGGEYKISSNIALRAGFANTSNQVVANSPKYMISSTTRSSTEYFIHNQTNYITAGLGYRLTSWYFDLAYLNRIDDQTFIPFSGSYLPEHLQPTKASVITNSQNLVLTVGLRF